MVLDAFKKLTFLIFSLLVLFSCNETKDPYAKKNFRLINQYIIQRNDKSIDRIYEMQYLKYPGENRKSSSTHFNDNELNKKLLQEGYCFQILTSNNIKDSLVQEIAKEIIITECSYDIDKDSVLGKLNYNLSNAQDIKIELKQYPKKYISEKFDEKLEEEFKGSLFNGDYLIKYNKNKKNIDNIYLFGIGTYQKDSLMLYGFFLKK
jgi:hypothetical protein